MRSSLVQRCSRCRETKPLDDFYPSPDKPNGRAAYCRPCSRAYARERATLPRVKAVRAAWARGKGREAVDRYKARHPVKTKAREILTHAIATGQLINPRVCEKCGKDERVEGHHDDYSAPLSVRWLCRWCHRAWHREHGEGRNADGPVPPSKRLLQRERRRARHSLIRSLLARGMRQKDIAAELGVTQATICQDLKALRREYTNHE